MTGTEPKHLQTLELLQNEARTFASTLSPQTKDQATLVLLSGELGAGKTSFTQGVARAFGVDESVTSPTFVLEKIYELPEATARGFKRLVHIDAYRLESGRALAPLGFDELMQDKHNVILLEWPERVAEGLPEPEARITLEVVTEGGRMITYA